VKPWVASTVLKLVALFLAVVLWFVVSAPRRERMSERAFSVPLSLIAIPRTVVITTPVPTNVSVRLPGPESQVNKIREVATERIIMTSRTETFIQEVPVVSDSPHVRVISPLTTQVTVPVIAEVGPSLPTTTDTSATSAGSAAPSPATTSQEAIREEEPRTREKP
jgi:hypothetical protein